MTPIQPTPPTQSMSHPEFPTPPDPFAPDQPTPPPPPRRSRVWRFLIWGVIDLLALALVLAGAFWWWTGSDQSLATSLAQVQRFLPADQTLTTRDVKGSLRHGGHIGGLRWTSPGMAVDVEGLDIGWQVRPLFGREVKLGEVHARSVVIEALGPPSDTPTEPLQSLLLPIQVDAPFRVDDLRWVGQPPLQATALAGHYRFDGTHHKLTIDGVDIADGHYSATVQLQGAAPMALNATLDGRITTPVPGSNNAPLAVVAQATVEGTLAGADARLQVKAQLQPDPATELAKGQQAMQAQVQAEIAPWAPQPLVQAQAAFSALNLAQLWPQAPVTRLDGTVTAGAPATPPTGATGATGASGVWQIEANIRNSLPGPWDTNRLPLDQLAAQALFDGTTWTVPRATLRTGPGEVALQGSWSPAPAPWQANATVRNLSPATLHTQLAPAALSGTAKASQAGDMLAFDVAINSATKASAPPRTLRLDSVVAQGQWGRDILTLKNLRILADQAQVQAQGQVTTTPATATTATSVAAVKGQLSATVPGAQARLDGTMAPTQGAGTLDVTLADAGKAQRWVESLPGLAGSFSGASLQGDASLKGSWQGGWQSVQMRVLNGKAPPASAGNLTVQANLAVPTLNLQLPPTDPKQDKTSVQLRGVRAELAGHLAQASLAVKGEALSGTQTIRLQTRLDGGMDNPDQWRATIASLQLQLQDAPQSSPWTLQLDSPTNVTVRNTTAAAGTPDINVQASASTASLTGPVPGKVQLAWEPLRYSRTGPADAPRHRLQSKGQLQGLPITWAQALANVGNTTASNFGVTGNLVFGGNWDIDVGDSLRVHAQLARTSGDVQVQTGDIPNPTVITSSGASTGPTAVTGGPRPVVPVPLGPTTSAGVRQAQLTLDATDKTVRAQLIWDSANAGQAQADASTQLTPNGGGWQWAPDAPLSGKVQANLPSIGAWSVLAPPGWRVQGTLNANAQLSGTRNAPRWAGTLAADNLAIRSVVDGVDLQNGRLRASLNGQRIDITDFTLRGGTGSSTRISGFSGNRTTDAPGDGGVLSGRGFATWAAADTGTGAGAATGSGIRMEFDAEAKALRAMVRSDRQVTLSGTMQARLNDGQFTLRANLKTDRAAIILPDESAPQLGKDVVVRSASHTKPAPAPAAAPTDQPVARVQTPKPPDVAITFNLGNDFAVQGHGVTTRLTGELDIRSTQGLGSPPRVTGEIRTDNGKYRAYGQQLDIETGVVRFNGTLENPSLDVLALRPDISVRAGVQITGTAQSPRVRLYSDPVMPDAEKLSWVVLGHSTANGGAEAALLQQAALSLLGRRGVGPGSVANRLGLDEVDFRAPADGESASGAVLTFGKRFSQRMYVTYESTLTSALGTLFIFYDLTRNLTLRAQTGTRSAVDLIYTVNFD